MGYLKHHTYCNESSVYQIGVFQKVEEKCSFFPFMHLSLLLHGEQELCNSCKCKK